MDVWNAQIMDVGLTITGYLAAAGLGMLLHSAFVGRTRRAAALSRAAKQSVESVPRPMTAPAVQFIDLRQQRAAGVSPAAAAGHSTPSGREGRRDRVEIIRLARQMLSAGAPADRVRRTLPISEAELNLLQSINGN